MKKPNNIKDSSFSKIAYRYPRYSGVATTGVVGNKKGGEYDYRRGQTGWGGLLEPVLQR